MKTAIVMNSAAYMPSSCKFGNYRKIAVVLTDGIRMPKQIHPHHSACLKIVRVWDRVSMGKTVKSAARRALADAQAEAEEINRSIQRSEFLGVIC